MADAEAGNMVEEAGSRALGMEMTSLSEIVKGKSGYFVSVPG